MLTRMVDPSDRSRDPQSAMRDRIQFDGWRGTLEVLRVPIGVLAALYLTFLACYVPILTSLHLTVDDELSLFRTSSEIWIAQGRWGAYLFETFVLPRAARPYVGLALFGLSLSYAFAVTARFLGFARFDYRMLLASAAFFVTPVWHFLTEFAGNVAFTGFGFLCAVLSAVVFVDTWISADGRGARALLPYALAALLGALAVSFYQTLVLVLAGFAAATLLFEGLTRRRGVARQIAGLLVCALYVVACAAVYYVLNQLFQRSLAADSGYISGFANLSVLLLDPVAHMLAVARLGLDLLTGPKVYGQDMHMFGLFVAFCTLVILAWPLTNEGSRRITGVLGAILLMVVLVGAALAPPLVYGAVPPLRVMMGVPLLVLLIPLLAHRVAPRAISAMANVLAGLFVVQSVTLLSAFSANADLTGRTDAYLAGAIYTDMLELRDGTDRGPIRFDTFGSLDVEPPFPVPGFTYTGTSWFSLEGGNPARMQNFMRALGYRVEVARPDERVRNLARWCGMPAWPRPGSTRRVGDVILVKLGEAMSWSTAQTLPWTVPEDRDRGLMLDLDRLARAGAAAVAGLEARDDAFLVTGGDPQIVLGRDVLRPVRGTSGMVLFKLRFSASAYPQAVQLFAGYEGTGFNERASLRLYPTPRGGGTYEATMPFDLAAPLETLRIDIGIPGVVLRDMTLETYPICDA